jgi:hypothetical protein
MEGRTVGGRLGWRVAAGCLALVVVLAGASLARAHEEGEGPNQGRLSLTLNNDFTTAYFFRGVLNERDGFIWQPSLDLSLNVFEGEGALTSVDIGFGIWNSVHSKETLAEGVGPEVLYETDYYPSISLTWAEVFETSLTYYWYTSPNGAFGTVELGPFAFNPTEIVAYDLKNT